MTIKIEYFFFFLILAQFLNKMKRRITAIIFILLANIVLLAHAVIPHHYHEVKICLENTHCQNDETHHQGTTEDEHEHDGDKSSRTCILNQSVILFSNQKKEAFFVIYDTDRHQQFFTVINSNGINEIQSTVLWDDLFPTTHTGYSSYIFKCIGLRAPPLV
jgi:hypothetical protein